MIIKKETLLRKLVLASRFTASNFSSNVLLSGVFLKKEKNILHFYSTNLNFYFHSFLKVEEKGDFEFVVEPKKLIDFLSYLPQSEIDLLFGEKKIIIKAQKNQGEFPLFPKEEFPLPPEIEEKKQPIKTDFLKKNLPLVLFACAADESRPVLTGINFSSENDELLLVGTDGFRLSLLRIEKEINFPQIIVSATFLKEVLYFIDREETASFCFSNKEKTIYFKIGDIDLYSRIIDGDYPPFEKVIPNQEGKTKVTVEKDLFLQNLKLINVFVRDFSNIVVFEIKKEGIYLRPKGEEGNQGNQSFLEAEVFGDEIKVAFNAKFLFDFLNHTQGKNISFEILQPDAPVVFKDEKTKNFLHIIMPVRIQE